MAARGADQIAFTVAVDRLPGERNPTCRSGGLEHRARGMRPGGDEFLALLDEGLGEGDRREGVADEHCGDLLGLEEHAGERCAKALCQVDCGFDLHAAGDAILGLDENGAVAHGVTSWLSLSLRSPTGSAQA